MYTYRRWTKYANPCNTINPAPHLRCFFFAVGSLLRMDEINQAQRAGTKVRNHNIQIGGDRGLPTTYGCRVWISCPSTVCIYLIISRSMCKYTYVLYVYVVYIHLHTLYTYTKTYIYIYIYIYMLIDIHRYIYIIL